VHRALRACGIHAKLLSQTLLAVRANCCVNSLSCALEAGDYVFKNTLDEPIDQRSFYKIFCSAQRAIGIRIRDLYATKDTYVSRTLTRAVNLEWLSDQTGVSDATLRRHYRKFIHADAADALELSKIDSRGFKLAQFVPPLPKGNLVEQKGFGPARKAGKPQ
jgi:hypothetical protein